MRGATDLCHGCTDCIERNQRAQVMYRQTSDPDGHPQTQPKYTSPSAGAVNRLIEKGGEFQSTNHLQKPQKVVGTQKRGSLKQNGHGPI